MNSWVVKTFVLITEVLSFIILVGTLLAGFVIASNSGSYLPIYVSIGMEVFFIAIFGLSAIFIEMQKNLERINGNLEKLIKLNS
jgi:uncharacterized membrane protein YcfT